MSVGAMASARAMTSAGVRPGSGGSGYTFSEADVATDIAAPVPLARVKRGVGASCPRAVLTVHMQAVRRPLARVQRVREVAVEQFLRLGGGTSERGRRVSTVVQHIGHG